MGQTKNKYTSKQAEINQNCTNFDIWFQLFSWKFSCLKGSSFNVFAMFLKSCFGIHLQVPVPTIVTPLRAFVLQLLDVPGFLWLQLPEALIR